ncbi:MAG: PKD domain-containing protein [Saprospiraceae bacterium]|nr:PKD domain-containing protein [Saprospiraceae bacterium]
MYCSFYIFDKGDTALFSNNSTNENQSVWDFGDQQLSFLKNPKYIYKKSGIYKVCLTVTNQCNASKYCQEININLMVNFIELPENYVWSISPKDSIDTL